MLANLLSSNGTETTNMKILMGLKHMDTGLSQRKENIQKPLFIKLHNTTKYFIALIPQKSWFSSCSVTYATRDQLTFAPITDFDNRNYRQI